MTIFEQTVDGDESRFKFDRKFLDVLALGRWVNPLLGGLGALVLGGYIDWQPAHAGGNGSSSSFRRAGSAVAATVAASAQQRDRHRNQFWCGARRVATGLDHRSDEGRIRGGARLGLGHGRRLARHAP